MALVARRTGKRRRLMADINVVPYVDVMLVLVVILMVAAPFVNPGVVETADRGEGGAAEGDAGKSHGAQRWPHFAVDAGRRDGVQKGELAGRRAKPSKGRSKTPVVIEADSKVQYDAVISVMSESAEGGRRAWSAVRCVYAQ